MATAAEKFAALNLSPEVIESYERKFKAFDLNKDGIMTVRAFAAVSRVLGYKLSKEEILEIFDKKEDTGTISFEEFVVGMQARAGKLKEQGENFGPYRQAFHCIDVRRRGYITADDAYPVLRHELGFDLDKTERLVDMYDKNQDYRLSLPEFIPFYQKVRQLKANLLEAFNEFDKNHDGFIDKSELAATLTTQGFLYCDIEKIFRRYDKDEDGKLSLAEFTLFWNVPIN